MIMKSACKRFTFLFATVLLLVSGAALAQDKAAPAAAQPPVPRIAILNVDLAMRESKAAQSALAQLNTISDRYKKEIDDEQERLRVAEQDLQQQRTILAPEAFAQRRDEFQKNAANLQQKARSLRQAMDDGYRNTMQQIRVVLYDEAAKIANERGYNLVLPSAQIIAVIGDFNITPTAIERLNKRLPDVKMKMEEAKPNAR
jgi:outer membrane protein